MRLILLYSFLILATSCNSLPEATFETPDEFTGGFNTFNLHLSKDGNLTLELQSFINSSQSNSGVIWEKISKTFKGTWEERNNLITYRLNEKNDSIYSFFKKTDFNFNNRIVLTFSKNLDTAFILGIPALKINSTNH